ncbi:coxsackievirus and adenovirus receptor homolog [Gymnodraco acuticeps]|uniref:Coxsackievirus and adenovirus receptor homolog n=1 Tax=Gymnodraco acuticeps TaxID=8218 RepID=A0A6P8T5V5_GYMAC|nr:coxsackievirus and adenovirus receptor homolog [Gymnodraco acuticeps]
MRAEPGEDVTLQCHIPTDAAITVLEWIRPELEEDSVFFFRENRLMEIYQDPRYRGRVQLKDPEMKNGDASVLLKNVNTDDTGTYECRVLTHSNNRRKRNVRVFVRSVHLTVSEGPEKYLKNGDANDEQPGGPRGHVGLGVGLGPVCLVVVVVVVVVVGGLVVRSKRAKVKRPLESVDVELNP